MEKKLLIELLKNYQSYMTAHYQQDDVQDYAYLEKVADAILNLNKTFVSGQLADHKCKFYLNADWTGYSACECGKRHEG